MKDVRTPDEAQVERLLREGRTVEQVANDLGLILSEVLVVWHRIRDEKRGTTPRDHSRAHTPPRPPTAFTAPAPDPLRVVHTTPPVVDVVVDDTAALIREGLVHPSERVQAAARAANGAIEILRDVFHTETRRAELEAKRAALAAELAALDEQLGTATAPVIRVQEFTGATATVRAQRDTATAEEANRKPGRHEPCVCRKGCGRVCGSPQGRGKHEKSCTGTAA